MFVDGLHYLLRYPNCYFRILNGDYEVGIIDDEISIKMAEREVLKKVVSENTQKASYYTSNRKGKWKKEKIKITPRFSEVIINRKSLIYVLNGLSLSKQANIPTTEKHWSSSNTLILDEIAFCHNHSAPGKIWGKPRLTSAICEICGGAFFADHISEINNTHYCEKHQPSNTI